MASNGGSMGPSDPGYQVERPLDKGMVCHVPAQAVPMGGFLTLKNVMVGPNGLTRRPVYGRVGSFTVPYPPGREIFTLHKLDGNQELLVIDQKFLYRVTSAGLVGLYWTYTKGTLAASGTAITGTGTGWLNEELKQGDVMVLDADGSGDGPEEVLITSVNSDTGITLTSAPVGTYAAGTDYEIRRAFRAVKPDIVNVVVGYNNVYITDGGRFVYKYNASTLNTLDPDYDPDVTPPTNTWMPHVITLFNDRLFTGHIVESTNEYRQRIRWSGVGDAQFSSWDAAAYQDLPYFKGRIMKLLPLENILVIYAEDAIWYGTWSNVVGSPLKYASLSTDGRGLMGMQAVTEWLGGHFYVTQDNVMFFSQRGGFEEIGTPIVSKTLRQCSNPWDIYIAPDPIRDRIIIGFPESGVYISKMWSFNYKSKSWSYDEIPAEALRSASVQASLTWDDLGTSLTGAGFTATWDDLGKLYGSWDSMRSGLRDPIPYFFNAAALFSVSETGSADYGGTSPQVEIETGDKDYGAPNSDKVWYELSIKLNTYTTSPITYTVTGSTNRGRTWKSLGTITIAANTDEGKVNFRLRGSIGRFKLASGSSAASYTITEMVWRVKGFEKEVQGRSA